MVAAVHLRTGGVAVPQFPDGGGSVLGHVSPTGVFLVGGQEPGQVGAAHGSEAVHEPSYSNDATGDGAQVLVDEGLDDVLAHLLAGVVVGGHSEDEWEQVGGDGVIAVEGAVGIEDVSRHGGGAPADGEEAFVEGFQGEGCLFLEIGGVGGQALELCEALHHVAQAVVVGRRDERPVGDAGGVFAVYEFLALGWHAPVAIFVFLDETAILVLVFQVLHPSLHVGVVGAQGCVVAVVGEEHVEGHGQGGGPRHVVGVVVPERRGDVGDAAVLALRLGDVAHPFGVERAVVIEECLAIAAAGAVAQPRLALVALRTVHRHSLVVAAHAPGGVAIYFGEDGVGGGEGAGGGHLVFHHLPGEVGETGAAQAADLHVPEAMIDEGGSPPSSVFRAVGHVGVGGEGMPEILHPDVSGGVEAFSKAQAYGVAGMGAADAHGEPSGHVLSHVHHHFVALGSDRAGRDGL